MTIFPDQSRSLRVLMILAPAILFVGLLLWIGPIAQDLTYHNFVDQRSLAGISNFANVISNLPFMLVGGLGIYMFRHKKRASPLTPAILAIYVGLFLTGIGSAYYHLLPNNQTLVWDRLPMTIVFMAFFSILLDSYIINGLGRKLFPWLLAAGIISVIYWAGTERVGAGDLRPYILIQFLPILLFPFIVLFCNSEEFSQEDMVTFALFYLIAKFCEYYDAEIFYGWGQIVSGHTLKHFFAAAGPIWFMIMVNKSPKKNKISN